MKYALINQKNEVLEISDTPIQYSNPNFKIIELPDSVDLQEGDELKLYIIITLDDVDNFLYYSAVKQTPFIQTILQNNAELKSRNENLEQSVVELSIILGMIMGGPKHVQ